MATRNLERSGGFALVAAAAGIMLAMAHHPASAHAGGLIQAVHAIMILLLGITAFGFASFALSQGPYRPLVLAGAIAFGLGVIGNIAAATVNGFIVPALAEHGTFTADMMRAAWATNQAFARVGVYAASAAILLWSLDLLIKRPREDRLVGVAGLIVATVPAGLLLAGLIDMHVGGALILYAAHAVWGGLLGLRLLARAAREPA